ncbi:NAD+ synthase [Desulfonema magnum]|uniref:Glutamine-dependent NAD(+) synthetase n=1 Tax=Desulfonema magnum TaxID=45655 RepID=A0A975BTC1_9BACT|nr:NAD+ synthase [Desulfonema magnum]QTA90760.1 Glutamine-dependent NAD(+) synthetase [Desulfonema magnum]
MKIAIAQMNPIIGDFKYNVGKIKKFANKAKENSYDLIVFPELAISGYPPRDFLEKKDFVDTNLACLDKLISSVHGIGVICGFVDKNPREEGNSLYNAAVLFEDGKKLHQTHKRLLPTYDIFDEARYFEPGREVKSYPYKGRKIGITICEDIWNDKDIFRTRFYHTDPVPLIIEDGADLLINISASPFHLGKKELRWNILGAISKKYNVPLVYANQVGGNDSVLFDGTSVAFDAHGNMAARAYDFEEDIVFFDTESSEGVVHEVTDSDTESVLKALIMGTRDYVTKCGFSKVVIGLSGGIDSALTAYIAVKALGPENVLTVFMPSRYTSRENFEDTEKLAENLGTELMQIPIDGMFKEFLKFLSPEFEENEPGITEQNIQARIRGTILMGLSNKHGHLVLSTGNKSEMAIGYCTLYGDMNGGLSVISDVPKTVVYDISRFINAEKEYIPKRIIEKAPSAELKPEQTDQDDLPPYEVLDIILKGYVEDLKSVDELAEMGFDKKLVADIISKVHRNEYKRYQAAPGLKVTSKAFGYGRRYPLAQRYRPDCL